MEWSAERCAEARTLYESGELSVGEIAERMGTNITRLAAAIARAGGTYVPRLTLAFWTPEMCAAARSRHEQGESLIEIGRSYKASSPAVARAVRAAGGRVLRWSQRDGKLWDEERRAHARKLYESGLSLDEVAAVLKTTGGRVGEAVRAAGGEVRPTGAPLERHGRWNGGRVVDKHGYILLKRPDHPGANKQGYVREHRLVMEKALGRFLLQGEVVHHLNGDNSDNRPENLELFSSNADHLRHELKGKRPRWSENGQARINEGIANYHAELAAARQASDKHHAAKALCLYTEGYRLLDIAVSLGISTKAARRAILEGGGSIRKKGGKITRRSSPS